MSQFYNSGPQVYAWIEEKENVYEYDEAVNISSLEEHPLWGQENSRRKIIGTGYICGYDIYGNLWVDNSDKFLFFEHIK